MKKTIITAVIMVAIALGAGWYFMSGRTVKIAPDLAQKFAACESLPIGTVQDAKEGDRVFVNLPEDVYPFKDRDIDSKGADAKLIASGENLGPRKASTQAFRDAKCATHLYELAGAGTVTISAESDRIGYPDYKITFRVTKN